MRFDELDLDDDVLDALDAMNFVECTPIQEQSIDYVLDGRDLIACAQTGTGKTAAYLLPILNLLNRYDHGDGVKCVVMVPTHELAQQIDCQLQGFSYYLNVSSLAIHGGSDGKEFARQQKALKMGADIVIATPGRLLAHMKMGYVDLSNVQYFILDEADRMLDMGFSDDIMQVVKQLPKERQTLMYSATMPAKIQQLAKTLLVDPAEVKIAVSRPTEKIDQSAVVCYEGQKTGMLKHLFKSGYNKRVIVFASSKLKVKELSRELRKAGWKTGEMHSDLDQTAREEVMRAFRAGRLDIIIATDILARGIDIDHITMVVNYDVPREAEDYVHRIGRTARANTDGKAVTFVSVEAQRKFNYIERFLGYEVRKEPMPAELGEAPEYNPGRRGNGRSQAPRDGKGRGRSGRKDRPRHEHKDNKPKNQEQAQTQNQEQTQPQAAAEGKGDKKPRRRYYHRRKKPAAKGGE